MSDKVRAWEGGRVLRGSWIDACMSEPACMACCSSLDASGLMLSP
jgi:hypothetical protein